MVQTDQSIICWIDVKEANKTPKIFVLHQGPMIIGRARDCYIRLSDRGVKRKHAEIIPDENKLRIRSLGKNCVTRINDRLLDERQSYLLQDGDKISIGENIELKTWTLDSTLEKNKASTLEKDEIENAIQFLIDNTPRDILEGVSFLMQKSGGRWCIPHHILFGAKVRNWLRIGGFSWNYSVLDSMWAYLIGEAARRKIQPIKHLTLYQISLFIKRNYRRFLEKISTYLICGKNEYETTQSNKSEQAHAITYTKV